MSASRPGTPRPGGYRLVSADPELHSDAQIERSFAPSVRIPWVVVTTVITALASVCGTYFATRAPTADLHAAEYRALDQHLAELASTVDRLSVTVARNADQARNDTALVVTELHSYVAAHAR